MCRDFVFVRFHLLTFHFIEFRTCRTQPRSISRQTVEGSLGFAQTMKTSKVDRWFRLIDNQGCNRTRGTSCVAVEPHFGCNPDCFDYERNAMKVWRAKLLWSGFARGLLEASCPQFLAVLAALPHRGGGGGRGCLLACCAVLPVMECLCFPVFTAGSFDGSWLLVGLHNGCGVALAW